MHNDHAPSLFFRVKLRVLKFGIDTISLIPFFGRIGIHNSYDLTFRREKISFFLPPSLRDISLLFLTDQHVGGTIDPIARTVRKGISQLIRKNGNKKTIVLYGGDFICGSVFFRTAFQKDIYSTMTQLLLPCEGLPQYSVIGNHDEEDIHWTGMRAFLEQKGIKFLEKPDDMQFVKIDEGIICIHGIHTLTDRLHTLGKKECDNLMDKYIEKLTTTKTDLHIVLIHNPDGLEFLLQRLKKTHKKLTTPTLFFAGHTHGASIDLPFIRRLDLWLCHTIFNRYKGWYTPDAKNSDTGNWKLYVSTGMGSAPGFDFRINAKPEVVLFTL